MSRLGEALLVLLSQLAPASTSTIAAKEDASCFSQWEYARAADVIRTYEPELDLRGCHVLDLGTGLGGKLAYYQQLGPASITTVDIEPDRSAAARTFIAAREPGGEIRFATADAAHLPFADGTFEAVISNETFEHIQRPLPALQEVARVTRPGGWVFISFPPYYAPWGAHLNNWITLPWVQVVFSEPTLINAAVTLDEKLQVARRLAPETRLDLRGCQTLPHINKVTLGWFEAMLARTALRLVRKSFFGPGWRSQSRWHKLVHPLTRLPGLRELFTSHAVYVLQK